MHDFLPWLFIIAASAGMVAWLCSLWLSLSLALSNEVSSSAGSQLNSAARRTLLNEKETLLLEIRDVSFEHDAGKLSDADYEDLNAKLRAQARHVLQELDEGAESFRDEADALIAERLADET